MWNSIISYLSAVLAYWWFLIPGVAAEFAWVIRFFWNGYDDWASEHFDRARQQRLGRGLAVVGLFIAMFLAYHHERTERLKLADVKADDAKNSCGAILETLGQSEGADVINRLIRITSNKKTPYGVTFTVRGPDLMDFRVSSRDSRRLDMTSEKKLLDGLSIFVNTPRGLFDVSIAAKNPNAIIFGYEFECEG